MRKQNRIWLVGLLLTIGILISGWCLPYWWSHWQDHHMENTIEEYAVENPALQVNNKLMDKLNTIYRGYYTPLEMEGDAGVYSEHTREQIETLAREQMRLLGLGEEDLRLEETAQTECSYELLVDAEQGISFGVWDCYFYTDQNRSVYVMIDDESEKILNYAVYDDGYDDQKRVETPMDREMIYQLADQVSEKLQSYYGAEEVTMEVDNRLEENPGAFTEEDYEDYIYIQYVLTDGQGKTAQMEYGIRFGTFILR